MGRGRARAKQAKIARELKYHAPSTDLRALQQELATGEDEDHPADILVDGEGTDDRERPLDPR
ncbi:DUF3073 domain-containing protein [Streptomyces actinomycinicus]|uniref:DUF3073 domain-containing protein n=1 Tax=Streptomyces actinomycinicus TaxID=1695166 RepID=A0A937EJ98_9ACTN|nr:DUF3073 domain-containing protein [Streptomyces actinomycinicus]MBL1083119.1 DUF3073 domain-containing protein [Streptomyces actinomycinicus]